MNHTILVIDDMRDVRENISELLELSGYHVLQAEDGYEGIRKAKRHAPELILCDIMMPGIDGYGVAEILARQEETKHIPFIYLTAKAEPADFKKGLQKGAVDYITKPFESDELIESISLRIRQTASNKPVQASDVDWQNWVDYLMTDAPLDRDGEPLAEVHLSAEATLFEQDDQANCLYFIKSGSVRSEYTDAAGRTLCFHLSRAGDFAGWSMGFQQGAYPHTAVAMTPCKAIRIPMSHIQTMLLEQPSMALTWGQLHQQVHSNLVDDMMGILYGNARENVARVLLRFAEWNGETWTVIMPRETLAKSIGVAYETVIRTISQFKNEGWVSARGRRITLTNRDALLDLLN